MTAPRRRSCAKFPPSRPAFWPRCSRVAGLAEWLAAHPGELARLLEPGFLTYPRQDQGLRREVAKWLPEFLQRRDYDAALDRLRAFKTREMVRIAARDLARLGSMPEITRELSNLADVCLQTAGRVCRQRLTEAPWRTFSS